MRCRLRDGPASPRDDAGLPPVHDGPTEDLWGAAGGGRHVPVGGVEGGTGAHAGGGDARCTQLFGWRSGGCSSLSIRYEIRCYHHLIVYTKFEVAKFVAAAAAAAFTAAYNMQPQSTAMPQSQTQL